LEELARMRLEYNGAGRPAMLASLVDGGRNQRLVATVHAIEVANRQHAAPGRGWNVFGTMDNDHKGIIGLA